MRFYHASNHDVVHFRKPAKAPEPGPQFHKAVKKTMPEERKGWVGVLLCDMYYWHLYMGGISCTLTCTTLLPLVLWPVLLQLVQGDGRIREGKEGDGEED